MINIYLTIRKYYEEHKEEWTGDYLEGFKYCLVFFLTLIENNPSYNAHLKVTELEKELKELTNESSKELLKEIRKNEILVKENNNLLARIDGLVKKKEALIDEIGDERRGEGKIKHLNDIIVAKDEKIKRLEQNINILDTLVRQNAKSNNVELLQNQIHSLKDKNKGLSNKLHDELYKDNTFAHLDSQYKNLQRTYEKLKAYIFVNYNNTSLADFTREVREEYDKENERLNKAYGK